MHACAVISTETCPLLTGQNHHHQAQTGCVAFCVARAFDPAVDMMHVERDEGGGTGRARRQRERRLLSMLRHELMAVAMAV